MGLIRCLFTSTHHLHRPAINLSTYRPFTLPTYHANVLVQLHHCRLHLPTLTLPISPRHPTRQCQYGTVPRLRRTMIVYSEHTSLPCGNSLYRQGCVGLEINVSFVRRSTKGRGTGLLTGLNSRSTASGSHANHSAEGYRPARR